MFVNVYFINLELIKNNFMKNSNSLILFISKVIAFKARLLCRLRYKISLKGTDVFQNKSAVLFLPNHQALIDPIILLSQIYKYIPVTPVISEKYFNIPVLKWYFNGLGAISVSDLETGSRDTQVQDR